MGALAGGAVAFIIAAAASPLVLRMISGRIIDIPSERSSHRQPTPRGGGIAIVAGVAAGLATAQLPGHMPVAAVMVAVGLGTVGLVEDIWGLRASVRLGLQSGGSAIGLVWLLDGVTGPFWRVGLIGFLALFWIVGFTNAFNFMDGINGISGAQLVVAGATWVVTGSLLDIAAVTALGGITLGAALGFLPWNFPRARFFMGDVGSYFSGSWLATSTIVGIRLGVPPFVMAAPLLVYGADTTFTLLGRIRRGETWSAAHRTHAYQRLVSGGWTHTKTTLFFTAVTATVAGSGMLWLSGSPLLRASGTAIAAWALAYFLAAPALIRRMPRPRGGLGT